MEKLRIVVGGFIGLYATGGVAWDYLQYPLGLRMLGHDVYYLEDTMQYSKCQTNGRGWDDSTDSVNYLSGVMDSINMSDRWAYRDVASGCCFGLSLATVLDICRTADVFLNVSSANHILKEEYLNIPARVLIDSDPMFTQVQYWDDSDPEGSFHKIKELYGLYNYRFSFGENINENDCLIPRFGLSWGTTRSPICLECWDQTPINFNAPFTTVMNWSTRKKLRYQGKDWGQKDVEFEKLINLPGLYEKAAFKIVLSCSSETSKQLKPELLEQHGWKIVAPALIGTVDEYRSFLRESVGEFSVAKETYVKSRSGWFSCRSACYLALGRPVITQETQWSKYIPTGRGVVAFTDLSSVLAALDGVRTDVRKHSTAAREIAQEYFSSRKVLSALLDQLD